MSQVRTLAVVVLVVAWCVRGEAQQLLSVLAGRLVDSVVAPKFLLAKARPALFDPAAGDRNRRSYEATFGRRGADLVDWYGRGLPRAELVRRGALDR